MERDHVTLVGAGLAGSLMALYLAQAGYGVTLYEKRPDMRSHDLGGGRSINLALSARGLYALEEVGLKDKVLEAAIPMHGRMMHDTEGQLTYQAYGKKHQYINSISRSYLNEILIQAAEDSGQVELLFEHSCTGYDFATQTARFKDLKTQSTQSLKTPWIMGCDGVGSPLRKALINRVRVNYEQAFLDHGYKELTLPPGPDGAFQIEKNALHIWPRGELMLIALPNPDGSFTCTLFMPFEGEESFEALQTPDVVRAFFERLFPDILPFLPELEQEFFDNPTGYLSTLYTGPWHVEDHFMILGDAAHAIVPFFGQGMNAAFEDCTLLMQALKQYPSRLEAFTQFYTQRKPDADAIAEMALENFIEMRDKVADPHFLLKKKASLWLQEHYPDDFVPMYSLVSFHRMRYHLVQALGGMQAQLLDTLCQGKTSLEQLDSALAKQLMTSYIEQSQTLLNDTL